MMRTPRRVGASWVPRRRGRNIRDWIGKLSIEMCTNEPDLIARLQQTGRTTSTLSEAALSPQAYETPMGPYAESALSRSVTGISYL